MLGCQAVMVTLSYCWVTYQSEVGMLKYIVLCGGICFGPFLASLFTLVFFVQKDFVWYLFITAFSIMYNDHLLSPSNTINHTGKLWLSRDAMKTKWLPHPELKNHSNGSIAIGLYSTQTRP